VEVALAQLAVVQHGVFTVEQLGGLGLAPATVRARTSAGRLHRVYRRVYSLTPPELLKREGLWLAAVLACGPRAVLSHRSAAALHGLRDHGGSWIDVTVPGRTKRAHAGIKLHRSTTLTAADVTTVQNIPCTTVARTLLDYSEVVSRRSLERAFDQAEVIGVFDLRAIDGQLERNHSRPGAARVRRVLNDHYVGTTPTASKLEEAFLALTRAAGLPRPQVNSWIVLRDGGPAVRADFKWEAQRLVVETDGRRWHDTHQRRQRDAGRDQRLLLAGWRALRITWNQVEREPASVTATIAALLVS
jgi:hypothetical protein